MSLDIEALYMEHGSNLRAYVRHRINDTCIADDLAQDVWMRVILHADRYRDTGQPTTSWIYRIAHNLIIDHYRSSSRKATIHRLGEIRPYVEHVGSDDHAGRIDARVAVEAAMGTLIPRQRDVIVARFYEGWRPCELGHIATYEGVRTLQRRALVNLRKALEVA